MCDVCKAKKGAKFKASLHFLRGGSIKLLLCYSHDQELFIKGQERFLKSYHNELSGKITHNKPQQDATDSVDELLE